MDKRDAGICEVSGARLPERRRRKLEVGDRVRMKGFANNGCDCDGVSGVILRHSAAVAHAWWVDTKALGDVLVKASQCRLIKSSRQRSRVWITAGVDGRVGFDLTGGVDGIQPGETRLFIEARPRKERRK